MNPDDRPTAATLLNYAKGESSLLKAVDQQEIAHPNIIQYIVIGYASDHNIQDSHYCLLMEWCSGITLKDFIKRNPTHCSTERIVKYTTQVASGLHYLHEEVRSAKFIHGDITSSNIMTKDSTGKNLKIIDVEGASQQPRGLRPSKKKFNMKAVSGYFMSPEMAVWNYNPRKVIRPTPDSSTDIYSLGCVVMDMYFMSQGQALWPDHDEHSIREAMQSEHPLTPRIPENLSDELKVLARQCLQFNPSDRPTAATILNYVTRVCGNPHFKCAEHGIQWYLPTSKKPLGLSGGFGVVHRIDAFSVGAGLVEEDKRHLALKIFHGLLSKDEIEKIETTLLQLNHPNIVKNLATGFFEHDQQFAIIMECCSGGTLTEAAETALPVEKQKNYVNQLIQGIQYLHEDANIIHKDLKGTNVVFRDETKSTLKICDIDSYSARRRDKSRSFISRPGGTPGFASPEMLVCWRNSTAAKGRYSVGRATDIWSLGAVVLEMYCKGKLIMPKHETVNETFDSNSPSIPAALPLSMDRPIIPEDMQQELKDFVSKCMALGPKDRPTIKQLQDEFSERFSTPSSSTRQGSSMPQAGSWQHIGAISPEMFRIQETRFEPEKIFNTLWHGSLALKNDHAFVGMYYLSGNQEYANAALPRSPDLSLNMLKIVQRMQLEQSQLKTLQQKMQEQTCCIMLACAVGTTADQSDKAQQTEKLRDGFVTYLEQKQAAGIVNVNDNSTTHFTVHVYPPCDFSREFLSRRCDPTMVGMINRTPHLLVVITPTRFSTPSSLARRKRSLDAD
ncbi:putative Msx2-interacting protein [Hypsibius exemplaris]|uniref:non-specific serine/threonine protein kinase n=1 Tax=Hypsibius exemplaris TaxID=2072580 RepID=A0A9X6NJZ0_HYPEX|nr:putative Msx2-interacting protein [Hypsibius exemplaris]